MNRFFIVLCYGMAALYLIFGRLFSYFGVAPFYPAELFLLSYVALRPGHAVASVFGVLPRNTFTVISFLLFIVWGLVGTLRGLIEGADLELCVRGFAAHYYAFFYFVGIRLSVYSNQRDLAGYFYWLAIVQAVWGIVSNTVLSGGDIIVPWGPDLALGRGHLLYPYAAVSVLALAPLAGRNAAPPLILASVAVIVQAQRALVLSMTLGVVTCLLLQRRIVALRQLALASVGVVVISAVTFSMFSDNEILQRTLTLPWLAARLIEPFSPDLAVSLLVDSGYSDAAAVIYARHGTIDWRMQFWTDVIQSLDTTELWLFGHGYGYSLGSLFVSEDVRTPHTIALYFLGYTGLIGLFLYGAFLLSMVRDFVRLPSSSMRVFLISQFVVTLSFAGVSNALETPHFAVPFYLLSGMAYGLARRDAEIRRLPGGGAAP